jgi:predicted nucleic acid-binding protein
MPDTGTIKVVDASALAAVVFEEPTTDEVAERLRDCDLVAPALLHFEMANVCWVKMRRTPEQHDALLAAFHMPGLVVETLDVDHHAVVDLALRTGLTTYDASYLWLARDLAIELVTLDRRLAEAAEKFL